MTFHTLTLECQVKYTFSIFRVVGTNCLNFVGALVQIAHCCGGDMLLMQHPCHASFAMLYEEMVNSSWEVRVW